MVGVHPKACTKVRFWDVYEDVHFLYVVGGLGTAREKHEKAKGLKMCQKIWKEVALQGHGSMPWWGSLLETCPNVGDL